MTTWRTRRLMVSVPLALCSLVWAGAARGQQTGSYQATAAADGARVSYTLTGFVIVESVVDVGIPSAQAVLDSFGTSRAYAASPYPGDTVFYGLAQGATQAGANGLDPSTFNYPLIASTSNPTKKKDSVDQGLTILRAQSSDSSSDASATFGAGQGENVVARLSATAKVVRDRATATVTSESENITEGIQIGELHIARVRSHAKVVVPAGGSPQRDASLDVSGVEVAGQPVGVNDQSAPHALTDPALEALEANGVTIRYIVDQEVKDGVVAPALEITVTRDSPAGPVAYSLLFGRASANASNGALPVAPSFVPPGTTPPPPSGGAAPPVATGELGPGGVPPAASVPPGSAPPATTPVAAPARAPSASTESIFLLIIIAAVAATGGAQLLRIFGVRMALGAKRGEGS